jgi:hypothetical protein
MSKQEPREDKSKKQNKKEQKPQNRQFHKNKAKKHFFNTPA